MCGKMILSIDNVLKKYKMKMKLFFRISVFALCISMSLSSFADDKKDRISPEQIDWSANNESLKSIVSTSDNPNKIYLYAKKYNKFVTVGGLYGAQPILAEVGMNFYVEKVAGDANGRYYIHSWVHNPTTAHETELGDYLGVEPIMKWDYQRIFSEPKEETNKSIYLFVDRGKKNVDDKNENSSPDRIKWYIRPVDGTTNGYQIYSTWTDNKGYNDQVERNYYLSYYEGPIEEGKLQKKFLVVTTNEKQADTFYFIKKRDYHKVIDSQNIKYINVSGLVQDARFERNNKGIDGINGLYGDYDTKSKNSVWQFRYDRSEDAYVFPNLQDNVEELAYMTAWVGPKGSKEQKGNYLIQKIKGLKPGLYRVNCQGFYFNPGKIDDKDNTSFVFASQDYTDISNHQTALKTIEPIDWYKMRDMTCNDSPKTADGLNGFKDYSIKHCVNAGKIFADSNYYEDKDVDSRKYDNSVAVLVKADEGSTTGTLYIGAGKRANAEGYAFFDNFQLFYMGDRQWYLDATNTNSNDFTTTKNDNDDYYTPSGINRNPEGEDHYVFPVTYNIRRYFNLNKWESLILPCTLTGDQVKQTFGGDQGVKLSVFDRVEGTCVYFRAVDPDKEGIVAGTPYIIKVGKKADIETKKDEYTFPWGNTTVKVNGPIYQVKGVVPPTFTGEGVTTEETTSGGYKVQFHGFYYDPGEAPANAYVVNNDNMYHLSSDWKNFVGTSWYITITDAQGNPTKLSFSFDGDSSTTAIENVARQEDAAVKADGFVYNLSGQRVCTRNNMSNLSSGIYIVAGKKFVVK